MSEKDTFQILADEITLIRVDMERLQRTSLNKDEAKALSQEIAKGLNQMARAGQAVQLAIETRLISAVSDLRIGTAKAAQDAISGAIDKSHSQSLDAARSLSKAAGEARREAWRYFGGFWVWLTAMLALGALLGTLAAFWIGGTIAAKDFNPKYFCTSAGGTEVANPKGRKFCAIWIDPPPQAGN